MKRRHLLALGLGAAALPAQTHAQTQTQRVVSVGSALTEIVYALGAEKMLVGGRREREAGRLVECEPAARQQHR